jgi:two-component system cell cycle sensor histidine kinase/response regulator CckA
MIEPKILNLNDVLGKMEKMLQRLLGEDIELVNHMNPNIGKVKADAGQLEQIIMNMAVNSRDAMPKGGRLIIETKNVDLDAEYPRQHPGVEAGRYVMFAVSDNGEGMTEAVRSRIFEPFFTTKGVGKGTGLGLSTVYGNVKQNGGHLWVYSEVGHGTTIKIYLPRLDEDEGTIVPSASPLSDLKGGTETVLVVEDEDSVRGVACALLRQYGYQVLEARNAGEAILISEQRQEDIDLMLTDVIMPNMNGRLLADRLMPLRPKMKVVFMSGYTDNAITHNGILEPGTAFLQKPFVPKSLLGKIREVLDT